MLTNTKRLDPKTSVNKPFENVSCQERIQNFFQEEAPNFVIFSSVVFFSAEVILSSISNKNDSRGVREQAPPENF